MQSGGYRFNVFALFYGLMIVLTVGINLACRSEQKTPGITADLDACAHCNMVISKVNQACGFYVKNEFIPFDSPACLLHEFDRYKNENRTVPTRVYFGDYSNTGFMLAESTFFLITDHIPTVMNAGVVCFAAKDSAEAYKKFQDEKITDWVGYQVLKGRPDRVVKTTITPTGMIPQVIVLNKDELVEWIFQGENLHSDLIFYLKGYEDLGRIVLPASGEPVTLRMRADKPGAGFPFVRDKDEIAMGMVKVLGAHTSEEEVM
jgi:hypothetical protein